MFNLSPVVAATGPGPGDLPTEQSFLQIKGPGLVVSAVKKGQWDDSLIIRLCNPTARTIDSTVKLGFPASKALRQSRRLGGERIAEAVALLATADLDLRGAREWDDRLVMEVLVARLARLSRR